jgi:hypothetical protein
MPNLAQIMQNANGASFISIDTVTVPKLKGGKANPFQGRVKKHMTGASVMIFQNKNSNGYENMVERRLIAEGKDPSSFTLGHRSWGTRIENTPFVVHTNKDNVTKHYLEVIFLKAGTIHYTVDDVLCDESVIEGLEADKKEGEQGGLNNKVIIRDFEVNNIKAMTAFGERHEEIYYE